MDHCQNASEPEPTDGLVEVPERREPKSGELRPEDPEPVEPASPDTDDATSAGAGNENGRDSEWAARALDAWADQVRQRHLRRALTALEVRTDLAAEDRATVAACSRAIVDDVLRRSRSELQACAEDDAEDALALFDPGDD